MASKSKPPEPETTAIMRWHFDDGTTTDSTPEKLDRDRRREIDQLRQMAESEPDLREKRALLELADQIEARRRTDFNRMGVAIAAGREIATEQRNAEQMASRMAAIAPAAKKARHKVSTLAIRYKTDEALLAAFQRYREETAYNRAENGGTGDPYYGWMTRAAKAEKVKVDAIKAAWERLKPA